MDLHQYHQSLLGGGRLYWRALPPGAEHQEQHRAVWSMAEGVLGAAPSDFDRLPGGKPVLPARPGVHFSLSHCAGLAVCFVAQTTCGVDAEPVRPLRPRVLRRAFTPEEQRLIAQSPAPDETFFRLWTLKESFIKATGEGLSRPLDTIPVILTSDGVHTLDPAWHFAQITVERAVVSVCTTAVDHLDSGGNGAP